MIKTFLYTMFGVCLFALGAVGAWYFAQMQLAKTPADPQTSATESQTVGSGFSMPPLPTFDVKPASAAQVAQASSISNATMAREPLATPVPSKPISAEEVFRFGVINRERMEKLKLREEALDQREQRMQLEYKDMEARHAEIEGLLAHINDTLTAGESLLAQVKQKNDDLKAEREALLQEKEEFDKESGQTPADQGAADKQAAGMIEGMSAEVAAGVLREFANDGRIDYALTMLQLMEGRNAAKILEALNDPVLLAELTSRKKKQQQTETASRPRRIR